MAKTIHTLAYMVTADTRSFTQGLVLTKNELKATGQIIEATRSPLKQFGNELSALSGLHRKGAISGRQYTSSINQLIAGHTAGIPIIGRFTSVLALGHPAMIAGAVAAVGFAAALATVAGAAAYAGAQIAKQITAIDDLLATSSKLGIAATSFLTLSHVAGLADIEIGALEKGIESMLGAISKGAGGSAKIVKVFDMMGLESTSLKGMAVEQQLSTITTALGAMRNQADRTRAATAIFGSAEFLRLNTDQVEHALQLMKRLKADGDLLKFDPFDAFDDGAKDLSFALDVTWKKITMAVVPALNDAAEAMLEFVVSINQSEHFPKLLDDMTTSLSVLVAIAKELPGVIESWMPAIHLAFPFVSALAQVSGASLSDIADSAKRSHELDASLAALHEQRKPTEDVTDIKDSAAAAKEYAEELKDLAKAKEDLYRSGTELASQLLLEVQTFGKSSREVALYKMEKETAGHVDLEFAKSLARTLTEMERHKTLSDEMRSALKGARTEWEVARDTIGHYEMALEKGIITEREFGLLVKKVGKDLPTAADHPAGVNPLLEGSSAAESFLAEARVRGSGAKDKAAETVDILKSIDKHIIEDKAASRPLVIARLGAK